MNSFLLKPSIKFCLIVLLLYSLPIILTTTMAKNNLKYDAKNVVICQMIGKLKMPNSPSSRVKKPKKLIFIEDRMSTVNGRIKEINISTLLTLLNNSFCNSIFISRNIGSVLVGFISCRSIVKIALQDFLFVLRGVTK